MLGPATQDAAISVWEDDPGSGVLVSRPVPDIAKKPLAFSFPASARKPAIYQPGTPGFRYWTAAEALRRGADFWAGRVPLANWQMGATLKILLDEGTEGVDLVPHKARQREVKAVLNNSFGFGGTNASLVMKSIQA